MVIAKLQYLTEKQLARNTANISIPKKFENEIKENIWWLHDNDGNIAITDAKYGDPGKSQPLISHDDHRPGGYSISDNRQISIPVFYRPNRGTSCPSLYDQDSDHIHIHYIQQTGGDAYEKGDYLYLIRDSNLESFYYNTWARWTLRSKRKLRDKNIGSRVGIGQWQVSIPENNASTQEMAQKIDSIIKSYYEGGRRREKFDEVETYREGQFYAPKRTDHVYPLLTTEAWLEPVELAPDERRILGNLSDKSTSLCVEEIVDCGSDTSMPDEGLLGALMTSEKYRNDPCYRLTNCSPTSQSFDFEMTDYFSFVEDCAKLRHELYYYIDQEMADSGSINDVSDAATARRLEETSERAKFADDWDSLLQPQKRFYKVGVNTLVVFATRDDRYKTLMYQRSPDVTEFPNRYHVAPAGTFQPAREQADKIPSADASSEQPTAQEEASEFDLVYQILREFGEELFDLTEEGISERGRDVDYGLDKIPRNVVHPKSWIRQFDIIDKIYRSIEDGRTAVYYTGLGFDLLECKPELTTLLFIQDSDLYHQEIHPMLRTNWEFKDRNLPLYLDGENLEELYQRIAPSRVIPGGAMAFCEGLRCLETEFGITIEPDGPS